MDFSIYRTPEPNRRVWSNVFVDSKTESYTLVTEQKEEGQPGYPLWHKEYPIGQGLADFLYTNLAEVEKVILQFRDVLEVARARHEVALYGEHRGFLCFVNRDGEFKSAFYRLVFPINVDLGHD